MTNSRRVELWLRGSVPAEIRRTQLRVSDRLRRCCAEGSIDDVSVNSWERDVYVPDDDRRATDTWERFYEFRQWATEHDRELRPGFTRRTRSSTSAEEPIETITLPIMCVVVYEDRSLRTVAPCSDRERVFTVSDCLAELEAGGDFSVGTTSEIPVE